MTEEDDCCGEEIPSDYKWTPSCVLVTPEEIDKMFERLWKVEKEDD